MVLSRAHPDLAARVAGALFVRPRRYARPPRERLARAEAVATWLDTDAGRARVYRWRSGPCLPWEERAHRGKVLLVHGFAGRATQLAAFVDPIRALGIEVVGIEAPAHGEAPGSVLDVRRLREVIRAVAEAEGGFMATVAHSLGAGATVAAAAEGVALGRLACIGGPSSLGSAVETFSRAVGFHDAARLALKEEVRHRVGQDAFEAFDPAQRRAHLSVVPGLVVHDVDDREVPFLEAERLVETWPGARLQATAGLGHRRILRDPSVVAAVTAFVKEGLRVAPVAVPVLALGTGVA